MIVGILFAIILIAVLVVVLLMWHKKNKEHEATMASLRATKSQSRSGTTSRPRAAEGAYQDVPASTAGPLDNPMYGMGAGGSDATYGDVPNQGAGAYSDIPASTVGGQSNPMYGQTDGGGMYSSGMYSDVPSSAPAAGQAYLDVAPQAAGQAYLDVAPNHGGAPVQGASNPMYGMGGGTQGGMYDDANA